MIRTRRSLAIATSILRIEAACWASLVSNLMRSSLVTPSTMAVTSLPKSRLEVVEGDAGVLDGVVEQGGGHGDVVEAEVGDDPGHRQRVLDVGLARPPVLPAVGLGGGEVGAGDPRGGRLRVPGPVGGQQRGDLVRRRALAAPPGQDPVDRGHGSPLGLDEQRPHVALPAYDRR